MQRHLIFLAQSQRCLGQRIWNGRLSSLNTAFSTSFFLHNAQWLPPGVEVAKFHPNHPAFETNPGPVQLTHPPLSAFRDVNALSPRCLLKVYSQLAKTRLTTLVVLTSMSAVALSPLPTTVPILLSTAVGTALCAASANTLNQLQEVPFDAQMARTRSRPLVRRAITPLHATGFAIATGLAGPAILWSMFNPATAILGGANIILYAGIYTWMKRRSIYNTWVGSVVGALPPLMGWAACGGKLMPGPDYSFQLFLPPFISSDYLQQIDLSLIDNPLAPLALGMLLFSWQFPHFNSLSHIVRSSYAQAGYVMLSVLDPTKNALVSLRHATLLLPICSVLTPLSGLTTWWFALTSLLPNIICIRAAWRFWRRGGEKEAKAIFQHSLWYLPVILGLMMLHKQGMDWLKWVGLQGDDKESVENQITDSCISTETPCNDNI